MICVKARLMAFARKHSVTSFRFEFVANSFIIDPMCVCVCAHEKHIFCFAERCCLAATEILWFVQKLSMHQPIYHRVKTGKKRKQKWTYQFYCAWRHTTDVCLVCMWLPNVCCLLNFMKFTRKHMGALSLLRTESYRKYRKPRED